VNSGDVFYQVGPADGGIELVEIGKMSGFIFYGQTGKRVNGRNRL
jgi:hypothetical protein